MASFALVGLADTLRENRLSAEYFDPHYSFKPTSQYKWERIGRILRECQYGISIAMNEEGRGYPIYRMNEIIDCIAGETHKFADITAAELRIFNLNENDVLFNRTNSFKFVGRTGIVKNPGNCVFASYLIRVVPNEQLILPEFLTVYLNTTFGIGQIRRRAMPSINQANVSAYELRLIPIPLIDKPIQEEIAGLLNQSYGERIRANELFSAANSAVELDMGLAEVQLPKQNFTTASFSSVIGALRSDAEHFQPACETVLKHLEERGKTIRLFELLSFAKRGTQPTYSSSGFPVVNSKHVRKNYVQLSHNRKGVVNGSVEPVYINSGDVLMNGTGVGTIGRTSVYLHSETALPDNHVTVLRSTKIEPAYLSVYLNTLAGQLQVSKHQRGSSGQIELYPTDIGKFVVWEASDALQQKVSEMIQSAHEARLKSQQMIMAAITRLNSLLADAVSYD